MLFCRAFFLGAKLRSQNCRKYSLQTAKDKAISALMALMRLSEHTSAAFAFVAHFPKEDISAAVPFANVVCIDQSVKQNIKGSSSLPADKTQILYGRTIHGG